MASEAPHVLGLAECREDCAAIVGGKALGLGHLLREGLQVPPGFAVTTHGYRQHLAENRLAEHIERLLAEANDPASQQRASEAIRELFEGSRVSAELEDAVLAAHEQLTSAQARPMAVRSSATAEDLADASFAGQQETYLWILGGDEVVRHVVRCWGSLFTPQAIAYRAHRQVPTLDLAMGVVVQCMVPAEVAGVMLTIDPVTGDRSQISIEASYGLGAAVVNGEVTPDRFGVDKVLLEIRSRALGQKNVAYRFDPAVQGTRLEPVPREQQNQPCLSDEEVLRVAAAGKRMEQAMGRPQDIEWAIGPGASGPREVFLLQARPETVWSQKSSEPLAAPGSTVMERILQSMRVPAGNPPTQGL
jgi:pyruvate,water dikinase